MYSDIFRLTRSRAVDKLIALFSAYMPQFLPVRHVMITPALIPFWHPQLAYEFHLLILPRENIESFSRLDGRDPVWKALPEAIEHLATEFSLKEDGYRLIINNGIYQDEALLHFHLVSVKANHA